MIINLFSTNKFTGILNVFKIAFNAYTETFQFSKFRRNWVYNKLSFCIYGVFINLTDCLFQFFYRKNSFEQKKI